MPENKTLHTHAVAVYNKCLAETKKRQDKKAAEAIATWTVLTEIASSMVAIFGHFVKDRMYQETDGIYFTEYDIRARDHKDRWPEGTLRLSGRSHNYSLDCASEDEGGNIEWSLVSNMSPASVVGKLVERIYQWRESQLEQNGAKLAGKT